MLKLNVKSVCDPGDLSPQGRSFWLGRCGSVRVRGLIFRIFHLDHLLVVPSRSFTLIIVVLALQVGLIRHQGVVVLQVMVVNPAQALLQMMILDALKTLVDPKDNADSDDKYEDKDDEAKLGCRRTSSRARRQPKARGLESIEDIVSALFLLCSGSCPRDCVDRALSLTPPSTDPVGQ